VEVRPVHAIQRHQPLPGAPRRRGRDLAAGRLEIHLLGLGLDLGALDVASRPARDGSADEQLGGGLVLGGGVVPELDAESARHQRPLGPAVGDAGKVPLDPVGVGVAVELGAEVDERLGGRDVEEVDGGEVEDDGAQRGAGGDLVAVGDLAAARAGVVPGAVLRHVRGFAN